MNTREKSIYINGRIITCFSDGTIEQLNDCTKKRVRQFGNHTTNGYRNIWVNGKMPTVHRLIAMAFLGDYSEDLDVDHINSVKCDNRLENLRMVTRQQNMRAGRKQVKACSSAFRGVSWSKRRSKWCAHIMVNGKQMNLGGFNNEIEAALAYNDAAEKHGFFKEALNEIPYMEDIGL